MGNYIAPLLREMNNARASTGLYKYTGNSTGYTERQAQEGVTQPTPLVTPNGGIGNFYFAGSNRSTTDGTGQKQTPTL